MRHINIYDAVKRDRRLLDIFVAKQEYRGKRDRFGRFLYEFSTNRNVLEPIVSKHLFDEGFLRVEWPENHKFAACLTHDVDQVYPTWKYTLFNTAKFALKLKPKEGFKRLVSKAEKNTSSNPCWNFREILKLEERHGAKSSFYFKATLKDSVDWAYDIEDVKDELNYITDMGWEVGLHGGYCSYNDHKELKNEKERLEKALGKKVNGTRMHYLRFNVPDTWRLLADLGFKYDITFGYPDMVGFRNGMCHPFKPYDLEEKKEVDIFEIPLTVMDVALFGNMHLHPNEAWIIMKYLIDVTERNKGVITILWHNTTFDSIFWGEWAKFYERILKYLNERKAWASSAEDIYKHWTGQRMFETSPRLS